MKKTTDRKQIAADTETIEQEKTETAAKGQKSKAMTESQVKDIVQLAFELNRVLPAMDIPERPGIERLCLRVQELADSHEALRGRLRREKLKR